MPGTLFIIKKIEKILAFVTNIAPLQRVFDIRTNNNNIFFEFHMINACFFQ